MPSLRQTSATGAPAYAWRKVDVFIWSLLLGQNSNLSGGPVFWVRSNHITQYCSRHVAGRQSRTRVAGSAGSDRSRVARSRHCHSQRVPIRHHRQEIGRAGLDRGVTQGLPGVLGGTLLPSQNSGPADRAFAGLAAMVDRFVIKTIRTVVRYWAAPSFGSGI